MSRLYKRGKMVHSNARGDVMRYVVELAAVKSKRWAGAPAPVIRLRLALKTLLKAYGFRCVGIREVGKDGRESAGRAA